MKPVNFKTSLVDSLYEIADDLLYDSTGFVFTTEVEHQEAIIHGLDVVWPEDYTKRPKIYVRSGNLRCLIEQCSLELLFKVVVTMASLYVHCYKGERPTNNY